LLAKVNRKRQYYNKALKKVLQIAQLLEKAQKGKIDYEVTIPRITFRDGLPDDDLEQAQIAQIRTGNRPTMSQKTAIMKVEGYSEEQADIELERIRKEEMADALSDPSIFNRPTIQIANDEDQ
jgi:hypothetical protein